MGEEEHWKWKVSSSLGAGIPRSALSVSTEIRGRGFKVSYLAFESVTEVDILLREQ